MTTVYNIATTQHPPPLMSGSFACTSSERTFQWCPGCEASGSPGTGQPATKEPISTTHIHDRFTQRHPLPYLSNGSEEAPSDSSPLSRLIAEGDFHPPRLPVADAGVLALHHLKLCVHLTDGLLQETLRVTIHLPSQREVGNRRKEEE